MLSMLPAVRAATSLRLYLVKLPLSLLGPGVKHASQATLQCEAPSKQRPDHYRQGDHHGLPASTNSFHAAPRLQKSSMSPCHSGLRHLSPCPEHRLQFTLICPDLAFNRDLYLHHATHDKALEDQSLLSGRKTQSLHKAK